MKNHLISGALIGALLFLSSGCKPSGGSANHDSAFSDEHLLKAEASELNQTVVVATPEAPIEPGTNVVWCGTFQLAWNEGCDLIGEDIHFEHEPPMVAELNKRSFSSNELDSASYVALAGFVKDDIHKKIRSALAAKFANAATPVLIPNESLTPNPNDIVAYSYLFKNLEFAVPFEGQNTHLNFAGRDVAAFGIAGDEATQRKLASQVIILNYDENGVVIELKTKSSQDHLILGMVKPGKTLNETIQMVEDRIRSGHREGVGLEDEFAVPKFNFDITRIYSEIEGLRFVIRNPNAGLDTRVVSAKQGIRFQMDEKGVRLKSEAQFVANTIGMHTQLIFNEPFLLMLKRTDAKAPYFAMWVDNPELLVKR